VQQAFVPGQCDIDTTYCVMHRAWHDQRAVAEVARLQQPTLIQEQQQALAIYQKECQRQCLQFFHVKMSDCCTYLTDSRAASHFSRKASWPGRALPGESNDVGTAMNKLRCHT